MCDNSILLVSEITFFNGEFSAFGVTDLLNSLNIINTTNNHLYHKDKTKGHLHTEGLLEGDMHYSELGNEYLANCIYDNFNNVIQFEMNNNNLNLKY